MGQSANLPVPVPGSPSREEPSRRRERAPGGAFAAQLYGQPGARRGLKAGRPAIEGAHSTYLGAEWSGTADRRRAAGGVLIARV